MGFSKDEIKKLASDLHKKIQGTRGELEEAVGHLKRSRGFISILRNGKRVLKPLTREIESLSRAIVGGLTGPQKQEIAVEVLMLFIPEPPWFSGVLRYLLGRATNAAVKYWNDHYGKGKNSWSL